MNEKTPPNLTPKEEFLYELGLVILGSDYEDRIYGSRDLSVSKDLIPKLFTIAQAVIDINSYNNSHPERYSPWHTHMVRPYCHHLEEFFGSFPFREAQDELLKVLRTDYYEDRRKISEEPINMKHIIKRRGIRDAIEHTWKRNVECECFIQEIKEIGEYYNPMAEGAVKSQIHIANENPDLARYIEIIAEEYRSKPRKKYESVSEKTLQEIVHGEGPDPEQDARWQDWMD